MASPAAEAAASAAEAAVAVSKAINTSKTPQEATFKGFNSPREPVGENFFFKKICDFGIFELIVLRCTYGADI